LGQGKKKGGGGGGDLGWEKGGKKEIWVSKSEANRDHSGMECGEEKEVCVTGKKDECTRSGGQGNRRQGERFAMEIFSDGHLKNGSQKRRTQKTKPHF